MPFKVEAHFHDPLGIIKNAAEMGNLAPRQIDTAVRAGVTAGAKYIAKFERELLRENGKHDSKVTRTSVPRGGSPMMVTGALARSVSVTPALRVGFSDYKAQVGPGAWPSADVSSAMKYAHVQEYGMTIRAKNPFGMRFIYGGDKYNHVRQVTVPARPFVAETVMRVGEEAQRVFEAAMHDRLYKYWFDPFQGFAGQGGVSDFG